jgi:ABC-type polysaccharide/polyol phosphate export permease
LCKDVEIFRKPITSLTQIPHSFVAFLYQLVCVVVFFLISGFCPTISFILLLSTMLFLFV